MRYAFKKLSPFKRRTHNAKYRARKYNATGIFTARTITNLYVKQRGNCAICSISLFGKFETDHVIPLSKNGSNNPDNIQLVRPKCNKEKGCKPIWKRRSNCWTNPSENKNVCGIEFMRKRTDADYVMRWPMPKGESNTRELFLFMETKICRNCKTKKQINEFYKPRMLKGKVYYPPDCSSCCRKLYKSKKDGISNPYKSNKPYLDKNGVLTKKCTKKNVLNVNWSK